MTMHKPRIPNSIDVHVGCQIRTRRQAIKMSQEKLGDAIGVTFQQVQKYERGTNRAGASRLWALAKALNVPVSFFFNGLDNEETQMPQADRDVLQDFIQSSDGIKLAKTFCAIDDIPMRKGLLLLVQTIVNFTKSPGTKARH